MNAKMYLALAILPLGGPAIADQAPKQCPLPEIREPASRQLLPLVELMRQLQVNVYGMHTGVDKTLAFIMEKILTSAFSIALLSSLLPPLKAVMLELGKASADGHAPATAEVTYQLLKDRILGLLNSLYRKRLAQVEQAIVAIKKLK